METSFGSSRPYSVGVEEEFQILDAETLALSSEIETLLPAFDGGALEGKVKPELHQSVVEVSTGVAGTVGEAVDQLADIRQRLGRAATDAGLAIASAGTHPFTRYRTQDFTRRRRYRQLVEELGWVARRQLIFGLHVHVGVGSAEKAIACARGVRTALPELLAVSANSPFWQGETTGLSSTRAKIGEGLPRTGIPPAFRSFQEFEDAIETAVSAGCFPDYTHVWWDIRPHPRLGTLEVRVCDAQTRLDSVAALAALIQALVATHGSAFDCDEPPAEQPDLVLDENRWRAARDGLEASFADPSGEERPARAAVEDLVERCLPAAEALGCAPELTGIETILERGTGADEQLERYDATGSLVEVTRELVAVTGELSLVASG